MFPKSASVLPITSIHRLLPPISSTTLAGLFILQTHSHLSIVVIDEAELRALITLSHNNVATVATLPIYLLESPDLGSSPSGILALNMAQDKLAIALDLPPILQVRLLNLIQGDPGTPALDMAKQPVSVVAVGVIQASLLLGVGKPRSRLIDVDVGEDVGGLIRRLGGSLVLVHGDADGRIADASADEVSDTLDGQGGISRLGQLLVLDCCAKVPLVSKFVFCITRLVEDVRWDGMRPR